MTQAFRPRPRDSMARGAEKSRKRGNWKAQQSVEELMQAALDEVDRKLGEPAGQKKARGVRAEWCPEGRRGLGGGRSTGR